MEPRHFHRAEGLAALAGSLAVYFASDRPLRTLGSVLQHPSEFRDTHSRTQPVPVSASTEKDTLQTDERR